jgi:hypothetical protein
MNRDRSFSFTGTCKKHVPATNLEYGGKECPEDENPSTLVMLGMLMKKKTGRQIVQSVQKFQGKS